MQTCQQDRYDVYAMRVYARVYMCVYVCSVCVMFHVEMMGVTDTHAMKYV